MKAAQITISICCILAAIAQIIAAICISPGYLIIAFVAILAAAIAWPERETDKRNMAPFTGDRFYDRVSRKTIN